MLVSREELHQVKRALGRFYGQIPNPSKTDYHEYRQASRSLRLLLDADADQRLDVADLTIGEIQRRVESGDLDRAAVLASEQAGKARVTLIEWLEAE